MRAIISFFWILMLFVPRFTEPSSWQWVGPVGGGIEQVVADPYDPNVWFVCIGNSFFGDTCKKG